MWFRSPDLECTCAESSYQPLSAFLFTYDSPIPAHLSVHNLALNLGILGILGGSILGPLIGNWMDQREGLFLSAGLRLGAVLLLWRWG